MSVFGFEVIEPGGSDVTFAFVLQHHLRLRDDPAHRRFARTLIRYERIRRERMTDTLIPKLPEFE